MCPRRIWEAHPDALPAQNVARSMSMCHRGPCNGGGDASRFLGWGAGISPISRTRKAILSRMRRAAVRHLPISAPGAQEETIWWFLVGAHVRLFGGMAPRQEEIAGQARDEEVRDVGCPLGGYGVVLVRDGLGAMRRRGSGCRSFETALVRCDGGGYGVVLVRGCRKTRNGV